MPKMKTNRSAAKRLKKTSSGKLKRHHSLCSHMLTKKTTKRKRNLRKSAIVAKADERRLNVMVPY